jgi:hypothetical protein
VIFLRDESSKHNNDDILQRDTETIHKLGVFAREVERRNINAIINNVAASRENFQPFHDIMFDLVRDSNNSIAPFREESVHPELASRFPSVDVMNLGYNNGYSGDFGGDGCGHVAAIHM